MTLMFVLVSSRWKRPAGTRIMPRENNRIFGNFTITSPEFAGFVTFVAPATVKKFSLTPVKV